MKRFSNLITFLVYLAVLFVISAALLEVFSRTLRPDLGSLSKERERFCRYDPEIGWVNKTGASGNFKGADFEVTVNINSQGMRDREYDVIKSPEKFRIAVLGDSFTWGYGVEADQTFSKQLENLLPQTEVLNFGCSGYGQDQEWMLQRREVVRFRPDLLLVNIHTASDFQNNTSFFEYGFYKPFFRLGENGLIRENVPVPQNTLGAALNKWLSEHSVAWILFGNRKVRETSLFSIFAALIDRKPDLIRKAQLLSTPADMTCRLCREMQNEASLQGSEILFLLNPPFRLPSSGGKNELYPEDTDYVKLRDCLRENQLEYIDLRPVFEEQLKKEPQTLLTFVHDAHWNAKSHELAASAIRERLLLSKKVENEI